MMTKPTEGLCSDREGIGLKNWRQTIIPQGYPVTRTRFEFIGLYCDETVISSLTIVSGHSLQSGQRQLK
jgi:hypothetical protein